MHSTTVSDHLVYLILLDAKDLQSPDPQAVRILIIRDFLLFHDWLHFFLAIKRPFFSPYQYPLRIPTLTPRLVELLKKYRES